MKRQHKITLIFISAIPAAIFLGWVLSRVFCFVYLGQQTDIDRIFVASVIGIVLLVCAAPILFIDEADEK